MYRLFFTCFSKSNSFRRVFRSFRGSYQLARCIHAFEKVPFLYGSGVVPLHFKEFKTGIRHLIMTEFFTRENLERFFAESTDSLIPEINIDPALAAVDYDKAFDGLVEVIMKSSFGGCWECSGNRSSGEF